MLSRKKLSFHAVSADILRMIQILTTRIRFFKPDIRYKIIKLEYLLYNNNNNNNAAINTNRKSVISK